MVAEIVIGGKGNKNKAIVLQPGESYVVGQDPPLLPDEISQRLNGTAFYELLHETITETNQPFMIGKSTVENHLSGRNVITLPRGSSITLLDKHSKKNILTLHSRSIDSSVPKRRR